MAEQFTEPKRTGLSWAAILAIILWCAVFACCGLIWWRNSELATKADRDQHKIDSLLAEKENLQDLLKLAPCETQSRLRSTPGATGAAASGAMSGVEEVERACVFILSMDKKHNISSGTGFFVAPDHIVTSAHVVADSSGPAFVTSKAMGRPAPATVVAKGRAKNMDYALLKVDLPASARIAVLPFAPNVRKTERVGAWGFPDLVGKSDPEYEKLLRDDDISATPELSYSEGVVSAVLDQKPGLVVHTAPISPGSSGGPLVNAKGEVVGINTMIALDDESYRQASIALAAPDVETFLRDNGIQVTETR